MSAIAASLLAQVPPPSALVTDAVCPAQTVVAPVTGARLFTKNEAVTAQPAAVV
jgi:hypothetical protein